MKKFLSSFFGGKQSEQTETPKNEPLNIELNDGPQSKVMEARTIDNFNILGYQAAQITQGSIQRLRSDLDGIRLQLMVNAEQLRNRVLFRDQVEDKEAETAKHKNETANIEQKIENAQARIDATKRELENTQTQEALRDEQSSFRPLVYWTAISALVLVGFYLIVFYMSALNAALFKDIDLNSLTEVEVLMNSIFDSSVLSSWLTHTPFLILGAFLFMGFGAVPHLMKLREGFQNLNPTVQKLAVFGSYLACFVVDGLIAFKIDQNIHEDKYILGLAESSDFDFWTSENFYIVLALGFGAYVVWGFFYDQLLDELSKKNPKKVLVLKARQLNDRLKELVEQMYQLKADYTQNQAHIQSLELELARLKENADKISYNVSAIQRNCTEYFSGFVTYIAANAAYLSISTESAESAFRSFMASHFPECTQLQKVA